MRIVAAPVLAALLTVSCSGAMRRVPHPSVKDQPSEIHELHRSHGSLMRAWYWKKDEAAFWRMVSRRGPLDRSHDSEIFFEAFTKPIDQVLPGNRKMSTEYIADEMQDPDAEPFFTILNPGNDSFLIVQVDLRTYRSDPQFHVHNQREESFFYELPDVPYLLITYEIEGEGFTPLLVLVIWAQESGTWKVWNILFTQ